MKKVLLSSVTALSLFWLSTPAILIVRADESGSLYVDDNNKGVESNSKEMTPEELRGIVDADHTQQNGGQTELDRQVTEAKETTPSGQPAVVNTPNGDKALVFGEGNAASQAPSQSSRSQAGRSAVTGPSRAISRARQSVGADRQGAAAATDQENPADPGVEENGEQSLPKTSAVK